MELATLQLVTKVDEPVTCGAGDPARCASSELRCTPSCVLPLVRAVTRLGPATCPARAPRPDSAPPAESQPRPKRSAASQLPASRNDP
ncbi:hypothetical protein NDU88_003319 [Pleurodeles waltl]|uniref:Uncharacterized protein n=1 Tax=Pleurodeles waltl TaxID=8319 RepID=A0AAV7WSG6_PLEWA|nr:hypothetical protein NDU88_003319 [Pleurodeles waltl]